MKDGGSLVESMAVDRRVVGSNLALAATSGAPLRIVDLKRLYRNIRNELMNYANACLCEYVLSVCVSFGNFSLCVCMHV